MLAGDLGADRSAHVPNGFYPCEPGFGVGDRSEMAEYSVPFHHSSATRATADNAAVITRMPREALNRPVSSASIFALSVAD